MSLGFPESQLGVNQKMGIQMLALEKNGEKFIEEKLLESQKKLIECVHIIAQGIHPGMNEKQGTLLAQETLTKHGFGKNWHPHKVRFGPNTLKSFSELSETSVVLQESDMFFLDLGPILADHECDFGETFVIGNDPAYKKLRDTSRILFDRVKKKWQTENLTGHDLYKFAVEESQKEGYIFVTRGASGHRIGDFPHHIHYRGDLNGIKETLLPNRWILEIQIHDEKLKRGAFHEDIL